MPALFVKKNQFILQSSTWTILATWWQAFLSFFVFTCWCYAFFSFHGLTVIYFRNGENDPDFASFVYTVEKNIEYNFGPPRRFGPFSEPATCHRALGGINNAPLKTSPVPFSHFRPPTIKKGARESELIRNSRFSEISHGNEGKKNIMWGQSMHHPLIASSGKCVEPVEKFPVYLWWD